jgi:hypothetical protein
MGSFIFSLYEHMCAYLLCNRTDSRCQFVLEYTIDDVQVGLKKIIY